MRPLPFSLAFQAKKDAAPAKGAAPATDESAAKVIAAIEKSGGSVRPLAQNDDRREVSFFLQGAAIKDADIAPVAQLSKVVFLHLGKTSVTDAGLAYLKGLADLEQLHLEGTQITDKGLVYLKDLRKLTYLNLYNTAVSDAGLAHLAGLANLKQLYVWQTKVTDQGVKKLKQALPNLDIIRGGELDAKPPAPADPKEGKKDEKKEKPD
jgi:hypothetical protein